MHSFGFEALVEHLDEFGSSRKDIEYPAESIHVSQIFRIPSGSSARKRGAFFPDRCHQPSERLDAILTTIKNRRN